MNDCSPNTDCEYADLREHFGKYYPIMYLKTEKNSGPGVARQLGLDNATADWVMFIDDDDELYDPDAVAALLARTSDRVIAVEGKSMHIDLHQQDGGRVLEPSIHHQGTIYNRKVLQEKNIRFNSLVSYYEEDGLFASNVFFKTHADYESHTIDQIVYLKKNSKLWESLTARPFGVYRLVNLIGIRVLELDAMNPDERNIDEAIFVVANLLSLLAGDYEFPIYKEDYERIKFFVGKLEEYLPHTLNAAEHLEEIYKGGFTPYYGTFTAATALQFNDKYQDWLKTIGEKAQ